MTRNYAADMRALIDEATADGPYVPRIIATELTEKLRVNDPDLLHGWLTEQAEHFLWQAINDRDRSRRASATHQIRRGAFSEAAQTGTTSSYLNLPFTVQDGSRRSLGSLRKPDLLYVSADYQRRADENGFLATVMAAIAKKIGDKTVSEVYTEEQLRTMFSRGTGA
jgi:hypothetical protein